jgi:DNA-binding NtrC family response regulator
MSEGLRILVVDDDWPMARTLTDVLKLKGYEAEAAYSGAEALERIEGDPFDCVLTDIKMPEVNGVDLLRAVRALRPQTPVLFMTAYAAGELVNQGLREGAIASFEKPIDIDLLLACLSELRRQRSVVILDDDTEVWQTVGQSLKECGYSVLEIDSPDSLMEILAPRHQVVFLGVRLDGVTGLELLKRIRKRFETLPVVLTTDGAEDTLSQMESARGLNVHGFLSRPFKVEDILEVLSDVRRREVGTLLQQRSGILIGRTA